MKCLYCNKEFPKELPELIYECTCGVSYAKEFIETANKEEWEQVRKWKLFKVYNFRDGNKTLYCYSIKNKIVHPLHYKIYHLLVKWGWIKEWALSQDKQ
jgi:hypothetical protein